VGDWWEIDYENYITATEVKRQPRGYNLKEGWGKPQRWRYEIVGADTVRGNDCFVLETSKGGLIQTRWHRKKDLLVMREGYDLLNNRLWRESHSKIEKKYQMRLSEITNVGPIGRPANNTLPLGMPLFGKAWNNSKYKQSISFIGRKKLIENVRAEIRDRVDEEAGQENAVITITGGVAGIAKQYWTSNLPFCVYGEDYIPSGLERSRYTLVDYGKGVTADDK
jgi:hypothetical protein